MSITRGVDLTSDLVPYSDEWWQWRHAVNERQRIKNMLRARARAAVVRRHQEEYDVELAMLALGEPRLWQ